MDPGKASLTAQASVAVRAIERFHPPDSRLFTDPLARALMGPPFWRWLVGLFRFAWFRIPVLAMRELQFPGVRGGLLCRTRYIDDALGAALDTGVEQVVILGAGFDSRACRIPGMERVRVFEVDHPLTQAQKVARLQRALGSLPSHVSFVPVDFNRQDLDAALSGAGFRPGLSTFFIWEGVTQYLTAEAVDATLRFVSCRAGAGSRIVFTYIRRGVIDGTDCSWYERRSVAFARRRGMPWIFGLDPVGLDRYLAARGLTLVEQVGAPEYRARYLVPLGRRLPVFATERTALAAV